MSASGGLLAQYLPIPDSWKWPISIVCGIVFAVSIVGAVMSKPVRVGANLVPFRAWIEEEELLTYIKIAFENRGECDATDVSYRVFIRQHSPQAQFLKLIEHTHGNPIPVREQNVIRAGFRITPNMSRHTIVFLPSYRSENSSRLNQRPFVYTWKGVRNGVYDNVLDHATAEEVEQVKLLLHKVIRNTPKPTLPS